LLEVGKACSIVLCAIAVSCANTPQSNQGARHNATITIAAAIPIFQGIESRTIRQTFFVRGET
jgi:hypothetical protein